MKIRTFVTCENLDVNAEEKITSLKRMVAGLTVPKFPHKESIVLVMVFDDVEERPKKLEIVLLGPKDKAEANWTYEMEPKQNTMAMRLAMEFQEVGKHHLKLSYDTNEFLGKYPFYIAEDGDKK